ncbi:MAG TPA: cytochrome c oxidase subunit II [Hyphomicrobiaceae bacterium]|nr:cytochrome c oxidase subunit II [Hyphomicrobiaceae bacterium]
MIERARSVLGRVAAHVSASVTLALFAMITGVTGAAAQKLPDGMGQPFPWQVGLQKPATEVAREINIFHDRVTILITVITIFVLVLMLYVMFAFREGRNPSPSRTTHNTFLELAWTIVPVIILIVIAVPSFKLLYLQYSFPKPDLTIKAIGNAWYWEHEYPDHGNFKVTSNMVTDEEVIKTKIGADEFSKRYKGLAGIERDKRLYADAQPIWAERKEPRLLTVNNEIVVPLGKVVHLLVTANDVIHNWTIPSFGSKVDAVPGRVTATWFRPEVAGLFYGQCSELCGKDHAFMPIAVRVVPDAVFAQWADAMKARDRRRAREILQRAEAEANGTTVAAVSPSSSGK